MHLAIIMDGNRRWAEKVGRPKYFGHQRGIEAVEELLKLCPKYHIKHLTIYALSTENLKRSRLELTSLFRLLKNFSRQTDRFLQDDVRVRFLGNLKLLPLALQQSLKKLEQVTKKCQTTFFQVAIAYGGRDEILRAAKKIKNFTEANFTQALDTAGLPDPDLLVRTGGHQRLSNFLPWQLAYTELYFTNLYWPEFNELALRKALAFFKKQQRNFGK